MVSDFAQQWISNTKPSVRLNDVFLGSRVQGGIDLGLTQGMGQLRTP